MIIHFMVRVCIVQDLVTPKGPLTARRGPSPRGGNLGGAMVNPVGKDRRAASQTAKSNASRWALATMTVEGASHLGLTGSEASEERGLPEGAEEREYGPGSGLSAPGCRRRCVWRSARHTICCGPTA
jgi:hypothetical protein